MINSNLSTENNKIYVGSVAIDCISMPSLMRQLDEIVDHGNSHYVCFCDLKLWTSGMTDENTCRVLDKASIVLPDGIFVTAGAWLKGAKNCRRLSGPLVMLEYCRHGVEEGLRHFLYGGAKGVVELLAAELKQRFPGIQITGYYSPPFRPLTPQEERDVKSQIEASQADVLWVGLGAPKQEHWMAAHVGRIDVPLMLGVGAAFDFHSGRRKRAPAFVQKAGLEWAFCTVTAGRKVFFRNVKYIFLLAYILIRQILVRMRTLVTG